MAGLRVGQAYGVGFGLAVPDPQRLIADFYS